MERFKYVADERIGISLDGRYTVYVIISNRGEIKLMHILLRKIYK